MGLHPAVDSYIQQVLDLQDRHRQQTSRLIAPAELMASHLMASGAFYLAGGEVGWREEAIARSGGLMKAIALPSHDVAHRGDAVWLSFLPSTYAKEVHTAKELEKKGCAVVAFGPSPPGGRPDFRTWVDSLTPWDGDNNYTRLGNVMSLWTLTGEVAASTARQGKTLAFWQNSWYPEGDVRNGLYKECMFHDGVPRMEPVEVGVVSRAYLDYVGGVFRKIQTYEIEKIVKAGKKAGQRARESRPPAFIALSHLMPHLVDRQSKLLRYFDAGVDRKILEVFLSRNDLLICLWHNGVPPDVWRAVRRAKARAVWVVCPLPDQVNYEHHGDVFVNQHWQLGDCAVEVPGYDVRILPPSGVAQLFIYEILLRVAGTQ